VRILALDLSKTATGFACWGPEDSCVASGHWVLGSEWTDDGTVFAKLHERMTDLHTVGRIDAVFIEDAIDARALHGHTNIDTLKLLSGLAAHAKSWSAAMGCRMLREVNMSTWRRHFIGKMKRGTRTVDLKEFAMRRCRELGFNPKRHDEAEALGLLDYACSDLGVTPFWRVEAPLVQQFAGRAR